MLRQRFRPRLVGTDADRCAATTARVMVKRAAVSIQNVNLPAEGKDKPIKKGQAWKYPGGVIARMEGGPAHLRDHIDTDKPRRKQESNFFITINTNKTTVATRKRQMPALHDSAVARDACRMTLDHLKKDQTICSYLKFGPKHPEVYGNDKYDEVIEKIEWNSNVEEGETYNRIHGHIWMTVHHYSQVQINPCALADTFKGRYNQLVSGIAPHFTLRGRPYVHVKLLPQSNWTDVMKQYIHKGMAPNATC